MNIEDSYEGAVRRMQRLEMAAIAMEPAPEAADGPAVEDNAERMRELEELAALACEDNERVKGELTVALQELDGARQDVDGARGQLARLQQELASALAEMARAQQELGGVREENGQLRGYIASLQQALANAQQATASAPQQAYAQPAEAAPVPQQAFAAPQQAFADAHQQAFAAPQQAFAAPQQAFADAQQHGYAPTSPFATEAPLGDEFDSLPKSSNKAAFYFVVVASVGALVAGLGVTRPWARPYSPPAIVESPAAPPPVVVAPPPPPKVEAVQPKAEPPAPKAPPIAMRAHEPRAAKARPERKRGKHGGDKSESASVNAGSADRSDDPLDGTGL